MPLDTPSLPETLLRIAEKQERRDKAILEELRAIRQSLDKKVPKKPVNQKPNIGLQVAALLAQFPDRKWTAELFARVIGTGTSAAVRKTKQWKAYRKHCQAELQKHRKRTDIVYDDFTKIDEKLDRET
ncbi:hypothetical protein FACS189419_00230 [Planctomycetales bacterium]|nr:hypothetical protein FACS189419_00230 [Planctomycetales bacterium]